MLVRISIQIFLITSVCLLQAQNLDDNLLLYYPFDGNAFDNSENGFDATVFGASLTYDRFGNANSAYYFDGEDNYIEFPNSDILKPTLPVSFSFWVKYDDTESSNCALLNTSFEDNRCAGVFVNIQNSSKRYSVGYGDGSYNYGSSTRRSFVSNFSMDADNWHFVVIVVSEPRRMNVYPDCEWVSGGKYSGYGGELAYSSNPGNIGRHDQDLHLPPYYFKGAIDEFRYWNRALTITDIDSLCLISAIQLNEVAGDEVLLYPQPVVNILNISAQTEAPFTIQIFNQLGELVLESDNPSQIDMSSFPPALYIVQIKTSDGKIFMKKIMKR